jgi:hypothetical protein
MINEMSPINLKRTVIIDEAPSANKKIIPKIAERITGIAKYQENQTPIEFHDIARRAEKIHDPIVRTLKN